MIIATIPARAGSKSVPKKNLKLVNGYPLIAYSIAAAKLSQQIDKIIVSTDCEEIASVSRNFGAEVPFLRPAEFAQDNSPDNDHIIHAINWLENDGCFPTLFVHLRPTTPLRDPDVVDEAIVKFKNETKATSLRSAHECSESPFKWFLLKDDGFFTGINTDDMELVNMPRQMFPKVYIPNGYVDIMSVEYVKTTSKLHAGKVLSFVTEPCIEIDTEHDFDQLTYELTRNNSVILDYLESEYHEFRRV